MPIGTITTPVYDMESQGQLINWTKSVIAENFTDVDPNSGAYAEFKKLFAVKSAWNRKDIRVWTATGTKNLELTGEGADFATSTRVKLADTIFTIKKYTLKEEVTEETIKFQDDNKAAEIGRALAEAKASTMLEYATIVLVNGFTWTVPAAYPYAKMGNDGATGEKLLSVVHTLANGDTFSNVLATSPALNDVSAKDAFTMLRKMPKYSGNGFISTTGDKFAIVCWPDLQYTAETLALSQLVPWTSNNDMNVLKGKFEVIVLDGIEGDMWFAVNLTKSAFEMYVAADEGLIVEKDLTKNGDYKAVVKSFMGWGYRDVRHIVGSKGDATTVTD